MRRVDNLSSSPKQKTVFVLDSGEEVTLTLIYRPAVQRWQLDVLYGTFELKGVQLTLHPDLLRQWAGKLPFGLACSAEDGVDPIYKDDFGSGRVNLYVLSDEDVAFVKDSVVGRPE